MTRLPAILTLTFAMLVPGAPLVAQTESQPRLFISINGGVAFAGDLWRIPKQPIQIVDGTAYDTLRLSRSLDPGLTLGLNAALFRTAHWGVFAEGTFLGFGMDDTCAMHFEHDSATVDPQVRNRQFCDDVTARSGAASVVALYVGGVYRLMSAGPTPYVRVGGGVTVRSGSVTQLEGGFTSDGSVQRRLLIQDPSPTELSPSVSGSVGIMMPLGPGYQVRIELSDHVIRMERITGPATLGEATVEGFYDHAPSLTMAFDVVLEQRRGRRY